MKKFYLLLTFLMSAIALLGQTNVNLGTQAGNAGSFNTAVGYYAGNLVTGSSNSFFGYYAGYNNTNGSQNVNIGSRSGYANLDGSYNVTIGHYSGYNSLAAHNVFVGAYSGRNNISGTNNTYVGNYAGYNATGSSNVFVGREAGYYETGSGKLYIDNSNTSTPLIYGDFTANRVGINALPALTNTLTVGGSTYVNGFVGIGISNPSTALHVAGSVTIADGTQGINKVLTSDANGVATWATLSSGTDWSLTGNAGTVDGINFVGTTDNIPLNFRVNNQQSGRIDHLLSNTFLGYQSGNSNTSGEYNTAIGQNALYSNTTGQYNVSLGFMALYSNVSSGRNIAIGYEALMLNNGGWNNVAIGYEALANNITGSNNVAVGEGSLDANTTGSDNVAVGYSSLDHNTTGRTNVAIGYQAMDDNVTGNDNIALGYDAMGNNEIGNNNIAIGENSMYDNEEGNNNIAIGTDAFRNNDNGNYNEALGNWSGGKGGDYNVALGTEALRKNIASGNENVAIGYLAMYENTTGTSNIAVGKSTLYLNTTGTANTAIGFNAGTNSTNYTNTTAIGNTATTTASNQVRIGNAAVTSIGGQVSWSTLSDGRFKKDVKQDISGLAFINELKPVSYTLDKNEIERFLGTPDSLRTQTETAKSAPVRQIGFVAQQVDEVIKKTGFVFSGIEVPQNEKDPYTIRYAEFVVPLVKAVQELSAQAAEQQKEIAALKQQLRKVTGHGIDQQLNTASGAVLFQNHPNPFSLTTEITMSIPESARQATIIVYNLQGTQLKSIVIDERGDATVRIEGNELSAGMYLYALVVDNVVIDTKRMLLTK